MTLFLKNPVSDQILKEAIELRLNECWPAMNVCNALAGAQTEEWRVVREFTFVELLDEAKARKMPYLSFVGSVDKRKLTDTPIWRSALRYMPHLADPMTPAQPMRVDSAGNPVIYRTEKESA